jgi:NADPH-dependent 2,4-dienoyl-CoA reductase/sulfur reductase-like enzyme
MSRPDLLIIGGGAAGLSAAATAGLFGLSVELLEERAELGGNFFAGSGGRAADSTAFGQAYARGAEIIAKAGSATLNKATLAWRFEPDGRTFVLGEQGSARAISPKRLLIATGAMERPVPVPGAMLPGVMYAGAAQLMLKTAASVPVGRCVLAGSGPLLLLLARQFLALGLPPAAIIDTTPRAGLGMTLRGLPAAANAPGLLAKGVGLHRALKKARVPWHLHTSDVSIHGGPRAESVQFTDADGQRQSIAADLVLLHDGIIPNDQVTRQLGCDQRWNAGQHCYNPVVNQWGEVSRPGIFAAGDCTGIWGAKAAELSGELAALEIARQLGAITEDQRDQQAGRARAALRRQRAFRPFLEARFPPTISRAGEAADDAVICRCENVTAGYIRLAVAQGATGPDQLKSFTRCGMGPCQGRSCGMAVAEILARELARSIAEIGRQEIRAPLKPLPLGRIAGAMTEEVAQ